jgi:nicotinamide riboside kinase
MSQTKNILVFIGPHGAGKTTLAQLVAKKLGWRFDHEIGRMLREKALEKDSNDHALASQEEFDKKVIRSEILRDRKNVFPRIVETWHPGNFAYAKLRSPDVVKNFERTIKKHIYNLRSQVLMQPLRIFKSTALRRLSEPGPDPVQLVDFFHRVAKEAEELSECWGLRKLPVLYTDEASTKALSEQICHKLAKLDLCHS